MVGHGNAVVRLGDFLGGDLFVRLVQNPGGGFESA